MPQLTDSLTQTSDLSCVRTLLPVQICEPPPQNTEHETRNTPPDSQPILDFIASDETLDRYGEVIAASGWKLETYQRNPVFQNSHQYGDILFTLGRALVTEIRPAPPREAPSGLSTLNHQPSTCLFQRIQFAVDANPMARIAYNLYKGKFLNAVSVGFIPIKWEDNPGSAGVPAGESSLSTLNSELSTKQFRRRYLQQELLEVSAVAIPANPNALALGLKSGAVEKSDLKDLADLLRVTLDPAQNTEHETPPSHSPAHPLTHLQFLARLHSILRS